MEFDTLSNQIIGCAIEVHRELGPGLLESTYEQCLAHELKCSGLAFQLQMPLPVIYKGTKVDCGYRVDVLVEERIVLELKSVESLTDVHLAQLLTYLKLSNLPIGLLLNFNVKRLNQGGIRRLVN